MDTINPYNPLDLEALGQSLLRQLERNAAIPLGEVQHFLGSGIYALYYVGEKEPYTDIGKFNVAHSCPLPIYIGRAKDAGARRGLDDPFEPLSKPALWDRIREHRRSIDQSVNLDVTDFAVRVLVVMSVWIPLAEAMAIRSYRPLWNTHLQGFGIHAPGGGRSGQKRSEWDVLHPGRGFASKLKGRPPTAPKALLERMRTAAREAVERHLPSDILERTPRRRQPG